MADSGTSRLLSTLEVASTAPLFLSSFFKSPEQNYHNSEDVEIDVIRSKEAIAVPVPHISTGPRANEASLYVNKKFTPPVFKEITSIQAWTQIKRQPGQDPFEDPNFQRSAATQARSHLNLLTNKVRRSIELMASQVFQTGTISLVDNAGSVIYANDFAMRAAHKAAVSVTWADNGSAGDPLGDIDARATLVRQNGKRRIDTLIFGTNALKKFFANAAVLAQFDNTKLNLGVMAPQSRGEDATYLGKIWIRNYVYELWAYDGYFEHPQTGALTPYVGADNVIMVSSKARLDLTFGAIPVFSTKQVDFLNGRLSLPSNQVDVQVFSWLSPNGQELFLEADARPLTIPSEIDSFACIDVTA